MKNIQFIKMHGLGNDFVIIDNSENMPLENPLDKSDNRVPIPIIWFARLAFPWPV